MKPLADVSAKTAPGLRAERGPLSEMAAEITRVLEVHLSPMTARWVLDMACEKSELRAESLARNDVRRILDALERSARLFMPRPEHADESRRAIERLARGDAGLADLVAGSPASNADVPSSSLSTFAMPAVSAASVASAGSDHEVSVLVRTEEDVLRARAEARRVAEKLGFSSVGCTRAATVTSELARNIVMYAREGVVRLRAQRAPRARLEVVAQDAGPGILNLEQVLAGEHRSKLGMGMGLRGVRRLAAEFAVDTRPGRGTTVRAQLEGD